MTKTTILFLTVLTAFRVAAADMTTFSATIDGRNLEFSAQLRPKVVEKSFALLASCACKIAKPNCGAGPTQPKSMAVAEKQSHLRLAFSTPVKIAVPIEKVTLSAREMVITLPLNTGGIWVRMGDGVV